MNFSGQIRQDPQPGSRRVMFRGDTARFTLWLPEDTAGTAWIRTNIGHAALARRAVIDSVDNHLPPLETDWFDIPMRRVDSRRFSIVLPLIEVGHFEAKCFFMPGDEKTPLWPTGPNISINVEPANCSSANIIYNAFVRQFGPSKDGRHIPDASDDDCIRRLDQKHFTVIPRSGTFRDFIAQLDFIIGTLGCRFVHLLPVSPTPTTYGRMGRFGSPYAALHFTGIDPALAVFDFRATPLDQFLELVDAIHARQAALIIDIAVNHTGWAASLHETHPRWLIRDAQGGIHSPGAWGVVWRDLTSLDYSQKDLWTYIASVFLTWCRRGVDGFRCDAGYMIPLPAWTYIIARVREQFPETIFLLEGLGGEVSITRDLLDRANFNWAYSELFQNYDRRQIENYLPRAFEISEKDGITIHYAETHDNDRLAARSKTYAGMRTALCALCSSRGGFGFANGVEWFAKEKISVHEARPINWGSPVNQVDAIRRLSILLRQHPAFFEDVNLELITKGDGNCVVIRRLHQPSGKKLLIIANLDHEHPAQAFWEFQADMAGAPWIDLLTEKEVTVTFSQPYHSCSLSPGQIICLTTDKSDLSFICQPDNLSFLPDRLLLQKQRAKVLDVFCRYHGLQDVSELDLAHAVKQLAADPVEFCRFCNPQSDEHRMVFWQWPRDLRREVMVPPGHFLLVKTDYPFHAAILDGYEENDRIVCCDESLPAADTSHYILFAPCESVACTTHRTLKMTVYTPSGSRRENAPLLFLGEAKDLRAPTRLCRNDLARGRHLFLSTNGRGGMCRAHIRWGQLNSKYDALLAANLSPDFPEDRRVMFTRCRAWIVYQGYSQEIRFDSLYSFRVEDNRGIWSYKIPTGQGERIDLQMVLDMHPGKNSVFLTFHRPGANGKPGNLKDTETIQLILRPDIDDRNFHETTKAYQGPEHAWPAALTVRTDAFVFKPSSERTLTLTISTGLFVRQPEWHYMVDYPEDAERGLDPRSDLWSPGYFSATLSGNQTVCLAASVDKEPFYQACPSAETLGDDTSGLPPLEESLRIALQAFIVRRNSLTSVIAGYPWFLDWGRDSLIFSRGLIQAGMIGDARNILKCFGAWEDRGTLPNMIQGDQTQNRTTADAPLWFVVACADLIHKEKSLDFLRESCGHKSIQDILLSIGHAYRDGTPNRIRMDRISGLIYTPACFSWMDTNHPACTPRQGYCIEIQALWYASLVFLSTIDKNNRLDWENLAAGVQKSLMDFFVLKKGHLADYLYASPDDPATIGIPDDALRPNQLLAVTLGAVSDQTTGRAVLDACQSLLIPGAIRSLADRPTNDPHEVVPDGSAIDHPPAGSYRGRYTGNEQTDRKPAYHNGTAWTWLFASYCEAYVKVYGQEGKTAARAMLASSLEIIQEGCIGHFPEILDGDYPHTQRGCDAQAWGLSEWLRVWELFKSIHEQNIRG